MRQHTVSYAAEDTGKTFSYLLEAYNSVGSVSSKTVSFVLTAVPDRPETSPVLNLEFTSASAIHCNYEPLTEEENGGSAILSYELEVYRLEDSRWHSCTGGFNHFSLLNEHVYAENVEKGKTYQFRYRAWNVNGAGPWSPDAYILAAQPPAKPDRPYYIYSDESQVTIGFIPSPDNGGLIISKYELQISPLLVTDWQLVQSYNPVSFSALEHTLKTSDVPSQISANQKYRFRIRAVNDYGNSAWSSTLDLAVAPLPSAPAPVVKV